ncbi:MAG: molybdate ABC transporter substrate-binding protein [Anaerovoracaceae bacterium]
MKKKLFAIGLAAVMVFAMTACGSSSTSSDTSSASSSASSSSSSSSEQVSGDLYVSAAASMTESLDKVIAEFEKENPDCNVTATYDSSGTLKTQIQQGSPCDVFISAAQKQMNALDGDSEDCEGTNYVLSGTRVDLLENTCVLVVAPNSDKNISSWDDFVSAMENATSSDDLIFCMGNSDVPVGQYTSTILTNLGLDEATMASEGIITYGSNVKEVTSQVESGAADCGIIYSTDAYSAGMDPVATADTDLTGGPITYPAAVMQNTQNEEAARAFLDFLQTDTAMKEFEAVGFKPIES